MVSEYFSLDLTTVDGGMLQRSMSRVEQVSTHSLTQVALLRIHDDTWSFWLARKKIMFRIPTFQ